MAVALRQSRRFGASSPVTRYWLANCVGFAVTGGHRGVVEAVRAEDDPTEPEELVIRCSTRRTRTIPASAVLASVPSDRVLVVEHVPGAVEVQGLKAARVAGRGGSVFARAFVAVVAWLCRRGWAFGCRAWTAARPRAANGARRGWEGGSRLVASVPWHRFGPSVRSATTRAWQALSRYSPHRRTTSSPQSSESDS
jgi:hypothetical protein